jgi:hypothetical protein
LVNEIRNENTPECEMTDPKQASTMKCQTALGSLRLKLMAQAVVEVRKAGAQISYRPLTAETKGFGVSHNPKVKIQFLKKAY